MSTAPWIENHENAHEEEAPESDVAAFEADRWMGSGLFNWYVTFSFDERTSKRHCLVDPRHVHAFIKDRLREFGYYGPFVIVPHDNSKTRYFHAHCLLQNYADGMCARISDGMRPYGNVQKKDDGPIRGRGAYLYCANRAMSNQSGADAIFEERLKFVRRPRQRGSGAIKAADSPSARRSRSVTTSA